MCKRIERRDTNRYFHTNVYSRVIHKSQKVETTEMNSNELKRPLMDEWINKMFILYINYCLYDTYYSGLKRKELLKHATTWMNLENVMPSEISQTQIL